jgi:hypothetical protein
MVAATRKVEGEETANSLATQQIEGNLELQIKALS